jgi:hypothetical protein
MGKKETVQKAVRTWIVALGEIKIQIESCQSHGKRLVWQGFLRIIEGCAGFSMCVTSV